ncbi:TPA: hypothetical protein ACOECR_000892 [Stenotrophomonas maltophilia]
MVKKTAVKKATSRREVKKASAKKAVRKTAAKKAAAGALPKRPRGHKLSAGGIFIPLGMPDLPVDGVVPANKLKKGLESAQQQITSLIQEIVDTATEDYRISEIELAASFNAEGKFLGFGVGGEATIVIRIRPTG